MAVNVEWDKLPAFDPSAKCTKCGWEISKPEAPSKQGPDGKTLVTGPPPPPTPPQCWFCNGRECMWDESKGVDGEFPEHMHQVCDCCQFEWLAKPLG